MYSIGFSKYDLLLIRYRKENKKIGFIRYCLKDNNDATKFSSKKEAEEFLEIIKNNDINFINDSVPKSIVDGSNIDKAKLSVFKIGE